jgi:hypothetical protein
MGTLADMLQNQERTTQAYRASTLEGIGTGMEKQRIAEEAANKSAFNPVLSLLGGVIGFATGGLGGALVGALQGINAGTETTLGKAAGVAVSSAIGGQGVGELAKGAEVGTGNILQDLGNTLGKIGENTNLMEKGQLALGAIQGPEGIANALGTIGKQRLDTEKEKKKLLSERKLTEVDTGGEVLLVDNTGATIVTYPKTKDPNKTVGGKTAVEIDRDKIDLATKQANTSGKSQTVTLSDGKLFEVKPQLLVKQEFEKTLPPMEQLVLNKAPAQLVEAINAAPATDANFAIVARLAKEVLPQGKGVEAIAQGMYLNSFDFLKDPKEQELKSALVMLTQQITKENQGARPSDYDVKTITQAIANVGAGNLTFEAGLKAYQDAMSVKRQATARQALEGYGVSIYGLPGFEGPRAKKDTTTTTANTTGKKKLVNTVKQPTVKAFTDPSKEYVKLSDGNVISAKEAKKRGYKIAKK